MIRIYKQAAIVLMVVAGALAIVTLLRPPAFDGVSLLAACFAAGGLLCAGHMLALAELQSQSTTTRKGKQ